MHIITKDQRMKANFFKQLDSIVQGMPVAFLTIDLKLDENNNIESFKFGQTNQRYRDILRENNMHTREGEHYLSIHKQLTQKVQEAMTNKDGHPVNYTIYFPASGKTYEWLFMRDPGLEKCYVYAVDISELADSKRNLALTKDSSKSHCCRPVSYHGHGTSPINSFHLTVYAQMTNQVP